MNRDSAFPGLDLTDLAERTAPAECQDMSQVRDGVDRLDRALVALIAERTRYMEAAARIKPDRDAVRDEARIADVLEKVRQAAGRAGAPLTLTDPVWRELVERSIEHELTVFDRTRG